jgi:uncharacterized lipoprotein
MATSSTPTTLVALVLLLAACSSEDARHTTEPDAGSSRGNAEEDAGAPPATEDAAATPEPATGPVPLTVWVDDLIDHRTTDEAEPDTVDDKRIEDDTDETSFDKYLQ